MEVVVSLDTAR